MGAVETETVCQWVRTRLLIREYFLNIRIHTDSKATLQEIETRSYPPFRRTLPQYPHPSTAFLPNFSLPYFPIFSQQYGET